MKRRGSCDLYLKGTHNGVPDVSPLYCSTLIFLTIFSAVSCSMN